ncbi:hypothetical protein BU14_0031s0080 [Porphyra umbilicalis]|uniref:Nudix hydrolase domain-containing protein n=1 Tax=Porphyra umbilicalis TaxID=2786 RepID=A0A1X6PJ69_PORUM|nr:hypothetical protein BU14_0031s0080 [Porphyra umbilicalis]|eukprot:OSX80911.1 hypothetical protein BU14_0031s0080 [Porphyra umbilicalis]
MGAPTPPMRAAPPPPAGTPTPRPFTTLFTAPAAAVDFDPVRHGRVPHPDPAREATINTAWAAALAARPHTYNGAKFRLAGVTGAPWRPPTAAASAAVTLHLGLTDYRTYVGTHLGDGAADPVTVWGHPRHLALALGNAAVVVTADGRVPLLRRSRETAAVAAELDDAIGREVTEELYLPRAAVPPHAVALVGGVARAGGCGRPQLCYAVRLDVPSAAVAAAWAAGVARHAADVAAPRGGRVGVGGGDGSVGGAPVEAVESTELVWVSEASLGELAACGGVAGGLLPPEHWGAVALYWATRGERGGGGATRVVGAVSD